LTGADSTTGASAKPYTTTVAVTPPVTLTVPTRTSLHRAITASGTGRPGRTVSVSVTSGTTVTDLGVQTVGSDGRWTVPSPTVPADHDLNWSVTDPTTGFVAHRTSKVRPTIVRPAGTALVAAGNPVTVTGTALPEAANAVTLVTKPVGSTSSSTGASTVVGLNGSWSLSFVPTVPTTFWVRDSRQLPSGSHVAYPVGTATASAPASGYAGRSVRVTGNAGNAPAPVTLQSRIGKASYTTVSTTTAATGGHFAMRLPVPDAAGSTLSWRITTGYSSAATGTLSILSTFPPTVTGPATAHWKTTHQLAGTAVPGDVVTIWTRPLGSSTWVQVGSTRAASSKQWAFAFTFTRDIQWKVTSPSGTSTTGRTVITPSIHAPSSVPAGSLAVVHGTAVPGTSLTLYRSRVGGTTWAVVKTVTVGADGRWSVSRHPTTASRFRATSSGHTSRIVTITTT
jgi:hypothetical protein